MINTMERGPRLPSSFHVQYYLLESERLQSKQPEATDIEIPFPQTQDAGKKDFIGRSAFSFYASTDLQIFSLQVKKEAILLFQRPLVIDGGGAPGNKKVPHA